MHNAEVYMLLVRPKGVPVLGEAVTMPFLGQIELGFWTWNLHNEEERKKTATRDQKWSETESKLQTQKSVDVRLKHANAEFGRELASLINEYGDKGTLDKAALEKSASELHTKYVRTQQEIKGIKAPMEFKTQKQLEQEKARKDREAAEASEIEEAERNRNFEFSFSKRVDIATTQMLNSMKAGDVFPSATITIIQRPVLTGTSLVLNFMKLRLLEYRVRAEVDDTMTHMYEDWTAEFQSMAYAYKNNSATHDGKNAGQKVAQGLSQGAGSVRAFAMRNLLHPEA